MFSCRFDDNKTNQNKRNHKTMRNLLFGKCGKNNKRKKVTRRNCWIFGIIATTSSSVKVPDAPSPFRRQTASISIVQYVNCPWSLRYQKKKEICTPNDFNIIAIIPTEIANLIALFWWTLVLDLEKIADWSLFRIEENTHCHDYHLVIIIVAISFMLESSNLPFETALNLFSCFWDDSML